MARYLLNTFDEAERLAIIPGRWIVATVNPRISWPTKKQIIDYEKTEFVLFPQGENESAAIAIRADAYGFDATVARKRIMEFCSALAWSERQGIEVVAWSGGNLPRPIHIRHGRSIVDFLQAEHLPKLDSDDLRAALALYREGISLDNPFYAFLSLYKAISVVIPDGKQRGGWIDGTLADLDDHRAKQRRDELLDNKLDVGQYIRDEGRHAIAHAGKQPFVNPDEVEDHFRLQQDVPLLKNLAELAIEREGGVKRSHTIWKEHLYELEGFRDLIPDDIRTLLEESGPIPEGTMLEMPDHYTVLARRGAGVYAFELLGPEIVGQTQGGMAIDFVSQDKAVRFRTVLDFSAERLIFDPIQGIGFLQNRSDKERVEVEIRVLEFQRSVLGNGHVEIWDPEADKMLGRSETCIPVNCFLNHEFYEKELESLRELALSLAEGVEET